MSDHLIQQLDPTKWRLQLMGQAALLIEYDGWLPTSAFQHLALECRTDWSDVREAVAGYDSVVLQFGNACDMAYCRKRLAVFSIPADGAVATQTHLLTVDFSAGMDWGFVVDHSGFRRDAFIFRFCQTEFHVAMLGFLPGFVYLDGLPQELHLPRRSSPRTYLDAGSLAVGGGQAGIYRLPSPGGWQVLGAIDFGRKATLEELLQAFRYGDRVRFCAA